MKFKVNSVPCQVNNFFSRHDKVARLVNKEQQAEKKNCQDPVEDIAE
jgi:hypothetical protein